MGHLIIFLIVVIFGVIKAVTEKGGNAPKRGGAARPSGGAPYRPIRTETQSEEERMRKFMEALGLPPTAVPPARPGTAQPRPVLQPLQPPPLLPRSTGPAQSQTRTPAQPQSRKENRREENRRERKEAVRQAASPPSSAPPLPETEFPGSISAPQSVVPLAPEGPRSGPGSGADIAARRADLRALLKSPSSLRTAVVIREILGPPRGLQPGQSFTRL